jgi:hypothetical protein
MSVPKMMNLNGRTLIIPEKSDIERDEVAEQWVALNGNVLRLDRFWEPPNSIVSSLVSLYGNDTFCLVLEQILGLKLVSPPDDLINRIGWKWLQRKTSIITLEEASLSNFPCFIKPTVPKLFKAAIYHQSKSFMDECKGLEPNAKVVVSSVVDFRSEARSFILDGKVLDISIYEGNGNLSAANKFLIDFCNDVDLPETCVIDVGLIDEVGWVFIEANASWGAGLNGCMAQKVIPAILRGTSTA